MSKKPPVIIVTRILPKPVEDRMEALFGAQLNRTDGALGRDALMQAAREADVLATTVADPIDAELLAQAGPNLKLIANFGVGVNNIDLEAAKARGIMVSNTPDVLTDDTADIAMLLMLNVMRRGYECMKLMENVGFEGWSPTWMMGSALKGKALGVIGMGRIGQALAERARAFGMIIHYHNRRALDAAEEKALGATYWADLDAMLGAVDVVSINCPRTKETYHLLNAARIARMKKSAVLINTARGDIVDEAALVDALSKGAIAGAGLDVFEFEPKVHPGLIGHNNVVLLPHIGSGTIETRTAMGEKVIANIQAFLEGRALPDRVV